MPKNIKLEKICCEQKHNKTIHSVILLSHVFGKLLNVEAISYILNNLTGGQEVEFNEIEIQLFHEIKFAQ
jgi:hypothetical protein